MVVLLTVAALVTIGYVYQERTAQYHHQVERRLQLLGETQRKNVSNWRSSRMANAAALSSDYLFASTLHAWLRGGKSNQHMHQLLWQRLSTLVEYDDYAAVYLLDPQGQLLISSDTSAQRPLPEQEQRALQQALERAQPVAIEPQTNHFFNFPFFGIMAPVFDGLEPVGAVWLVMDLRTSLYPLLESWQLDSASAESVLIQREGDSNLISINPLPRLNKAALSAYVPLSRSDSPGVQAVNGAWGLVRGINHLGQPVMAMVSSIEGAPWWLVLQIDEAEALADARRREGLALGLSVGAVLLLVGLLVGVWQWFAWRRERQLKQDLQLHVRWLNAAQKAAALGYFAYAVEQQKFYISDATAHIFGWSQGGWFTLQDWSRRIIAEDKKRIIAVHEQAITQRLPLYVQYRICRAGDGAQRWVEVWAEMDSNTGTQEGARMIGIIQDITERKLAEHELAEHRQRLENQVRLDPLTQIANRLALEEALGQEWHRAARQGHSLALLMLDLDYFKAYNDRYGHVQGDACLRQVAQTLAACVERPGELVARYGGEEFSVLLPHHNAEQAQAVAQRLVEAVRQLKRPHVASVLPEGIVTISVGVAALVPAPGLITGPGITALMEQADAALYQAKQAGRNQCCVHASAITL